MKGFLFPVLALCLGGFSISSLPAADVEVTVEGVNEVKGQMLIGFFTNAEDFQVNPIEGSPKVEVTEVGPVVAVAKDLEPGVYSIAVIWDWNMNDVLDKKGFLKMPIEPYGFSNNPSTRFGPPKFEECTFMVTEEGGRITIQLVQ